MIVLEPATGNRQFYTMITYRSPIVYSCVLLITLLVVMACSTKRPLQHSTAVGKEERSLFTSRSKPPQIFDLTTMSTGRGPVFAGSFRQNLNHIDKLEFASAKNSTAPIIAINDKKTLLLLDSSSPDSWLTFDAAVGMNVTALAGPELFEKNPSHVIDEMGGFAAVLPRLSIGKLYLDNAVFYVRNARGPLDSLTRWEKSPFVHGVLGADFLRSFEFIRVSLRGRQAVFCGVNLYPYTDSALTKLPVSDLNGAMAVTCSIDGEKQDVVIDIAGDFELAMENPRGGVVKQLTMGDIVFRKVEAVPAFDLGLPKNGPPRIGRQLLERYDLVFNQRGRELLIEMPTR